MVSTAFIGAGLMLYENIKLTIQNAGESFTFDVCN